VKILAQFFLWKIQIRLFVLSVFLIFSLIYVSHAVANDKIDVVHFDTERLNSSFSGYSLHFSIVSKNKLDLESGIIVFFVLNQKNTSISLFLNPSLSSGSNENFNLEVVAKFLESESALEEKQVLFALPAGYQDFGQPAGFLSIEDNEILELKNPETDLVLDAVVCIEQSGFLLIRKLYLPGHFDDFMSKNFQAGHPQEPDDLSV